MPILPLLTVGEVADQLRVSPETVVSWIRAGELVAEDLSGPGAKRRSYRICPNQLAKFREKRLICRHVRRKDIPQIV